MDYRKLIKEEIAKLHTTKGVKVNPKLDSDLGEQIVADICRKVVKNCRIANVSVSLLEEAATLVGNPGTNISGSCDVACMEWQEKYERWRNER